MKETTARTLVGRGDSHGRAYTYWRDADGYIYQRLGEDGQWLGWLCAASVWDRGYFNHIERVNQ